MCASKAQMKTTTMNDQSPDDLLVVGLFSLVGSVQICTNYWCPLSLWYPILLRRFLRLLRKTQVLASTLYSPKALRVSLHSPLPRSPTLMLQSNVLLEHKQDEHEDAHGHQRADEHAALVLAGLLGVLDRALHLHSCVYVRMDDPFVSSVGDREPVVVLNRAFDFPPPRSMCPSEKHQRKKKGAPPPTCNVPSST